MMHAFSQIAVAVAVALTYLCAMSSFTVGAVLERGGCVVMRRTNGPGLETSHSAVSKREQVRSPHIGRVFRIEETLKAADPLIRPGDYTRVK